jgi:hypothetical protein
MHTGQQRRFPAVAIVAVLFILSIIPGQSWITKQFPAISGLVQINPILVFLDIIPRCLYGCYFVLSFRPAAYFV